MVRALVEFVSEETTTKRLELWNGHWQTDNFW